MSDLRGLTVVVTRPQHQAENLCQAIQALGAEVIRLPVIAIGPPENPELLQAVLQRIDTFDIAIFISANAVDQAMTWLQRLGLTLSPLKIAAVGKATARLLYHHGQHVDIVPQGTFNSEALLLHPDLQQVSNKHIVIFRGAGGREYLADRLIERGARVEYAECYRRLKPATDTGPLLSAWARQEVDVITITSNEALTNLYEMLGSAGQHYLQNTPIIGVSERIRELALGLGLRGDVRIAQNASDDAIISALREWSQEHH